MIREKKPSGPRPDTHSPTRAREYQRQASIGTSRLTSARGPTLRAPTRENRPPLADGNHTDDNTTGSLDFLPSPSFDDLQTSFSNDPTTQHAASQGLAHTRDKAMMEPFSASTSAEGRTTGPGRVGTAPRPARAGSFLRRASNRQTSTSSTNSTISGSMDPPAAPLAMRNRRQTHQYPPISGSSHANGAPRVQDPRSSIDSDISSKSGQRRRPSLAASASAQSLTEARGLRSVSNGNSTYTDGARGLTASRAAKAKSLQPPSRQAQRQLSGHLGTPEHNRSTSYAAKSPSKASGRLTLTPQSAGKRVSMMPTSSSHATGLGARTISPTDARRAKRLSVLPGPPPMPRSVPGTPPTPVGDNLSVRTSSRSPSMLPRKVPTPQSTRTTPDPKRKSYSSGQSNGSGQSFNTARTSTGSLQPRMPAASAASRLPTPKTRNTHSSNGNHEEEEVPPVPAIPKAYESPRDSPKVSPVEQPAEQPFFNKRKSNMPFDASSINSVSTNSLSEKRSIREHVPAPREVRAPKMTVPSTNVEPKPKTATAKRKNLQPLRLPPMNLLPLSTPTAAKVAALQGKDHGEGNTTPPPRRTTKTPSSPMTASKTSFFSWNRNDKVEPPPHHVRSSTATHNLRSESSHFGLNTEASQPIPMPTRPARQQVSPFISSSLPRNQEELSLMPRSKTSGDFITHESSIDHRPGRLTGPRALIPAKQNKEEAPATESSPELPETPSSANSLRRKMSLSWKRNTSKSNINPSQAASDRESEYPPAPPKHDNMPPPRLPASATMNTLNNLNGPSPSPSVNSATHLAPKRRKSSASSLTMSIGQDKARGDSWGISRSPKKDNKSESAVDRTPSISTSTATSRSSSSIMQKMLASKASTNEVRPQDPWTVNLDKDDLIAEDEMKRLGSRRKETEQAAKQLDGLRRRATPKDSVSPKQAIQMANLNIYERGEIVDYKEVYFCGTQNAPKHVGELQSEAANFGYDDERGDYSIVMGDHLSYRYEVIDLLGKGSFGQVVRCIDHKTGGLVAIKIIRNKKRFHQQALVEVNILQKLREWDPKNQHSMVNFTQSFYFRGHLCISTELLDMNLYEFIKSNSFRGFSLKIVRRFTKQLLSSLLLLKQHKVIHCDLKPENVLLAHPMHSEIKVIDFGSSCFENEKVYTYIQSRFYRSPEVILGMTYGLPIDMWSLGCILAELFTGVPIFPGENEQEQLACIMEVFGPPEKHLIEKSTRKKLFFDSFGKPRLTVSSKGRRRRPSSKTLQQVMKTEDEPFLDFLGRCLRWDPDRRLKPEEAIRHEFLTGQKSSMPTGRTSLRTDSPIRRAQTNASGMNRPLPDPPASFKASAAARTRDAPGPSPSKPPVTAANRRQSLINNGLNQQGASRRVSGPAFAPGSSSLPRAKPELAAAGASIAMGRRA